MIANVSTRRHSVHDAANDAHRNTFSGFVKNLLSIVSPSNNSSKNEELEKRSQVRTLFEDMYYSFPAFEEEESSKASPSTCHPQPSLIVGTSRIMC
ncbi:hypothetical protein BY458DRAFT_497537 [Sporodiniella umbellata]|nr:hypothetical protein BY458DRAFT_497537 [Sporodiniella umbellata]